MSNTDLSRRDFLKMSTLSAWSLGLPAWMPRLAFAPQGVDPQGDILTCLFLRGGADGLNVIIPQFEEEYYRLRPDIKIPESKNGDDQTAIDLDGRFALHPALKPLKDAWDAGQLAIVHATGSPDPTHSHFDAMDYMERGTPGEKTIPTGWIGRHLQSAPWNNSSPLRAIGMGGVRQAALRGPVPVTSLQSIADFHLQGDQSQLEGLQEALAQLYEVEGGLATEAKATFGAMDLMAQVDVNEYSPASGAKYPDGDFGLALQQIAQLAKAEVGLEVACLDLGGFDTHANQGNVQGVLAGLLAQFAQGLSAFHLDLMDQSRNIVVITMSEFGRRVAQNGSTGTDHGHGDFMFALGKGVNGGKIYTEWPGLSPEQLYGPGDLQVTIDYRDILAELVSHRLGNADNLESIFPGYSPDMKDIFSP